MPKQGDGCHSDRQKRAPRKYEVQFSYIIRTYGIVAVNKWIGGNGNFFEMVWWRNKIREMTTGQRLTNAEQEAVWGAKYTRRIRLAGFRLQGKVVKAFLGTTQEQKKSDKQNS